MGRRLAAAVCILALTATGLSVPSAVAQDPGPPAEADLTRVAQIASGSYHSCARLSTGQARCWGDNDEGQLGTGTDEFDDTLLPTVVLNASGTGPLTGVAQVVAGFTFSCARLVNGQVRCWGDNTYGQLGDFTADDHNLPAPVRNVAGTGRLTGVTNLAAGDNHVCARVETGRAVCWGNELNGQLGAGTQSSGSSLPREVRNVAGTGPLVGVTQVDAGGSSSCARLRTGEARCWGAGAVGQLGDDGGDDSWTPVAVRNPTDTANLTGVAAVTVGVGHACARLANGQVRCWGLGTSGQLGHGQDTSSPVPRIVATATGPLRDVTQVSAGQGSTCARLSTGQARCWGFNGNGQLGRGNTTPANRPVVVRAVTGAGALIGVTQLDLGSIHVCARRTDGGARCWGRNGTGRLGDGTIDDRSRPVRVQA